MGGRGVISHRNNRTITEKCESNISFLAQVPYETCKDVPNVECVTVLKDVPEVECTPEPYTECNDVAIDIPFLEPAEECEEVTFEDCVEVEALSCANVN